VQKYNKYALYEEAVQSPEQDITLFAAVYRRARRKEARRLREDFCGTFLLATEWVRRDPHNSALALDLDNEPLNSGRTRHFKKLSASEKRRLKIKQQDVISITTPKSDIIVANNFSFNIFKQRELLLRYFRACYKSLDHDGVLILEAAGGPGMIEKNKERKTLYDARKKAYAVYVWDQKYFNPINHDARYSIHFKFKDGTQMKDVFTYDWRLWTLPELRDVMIDAGFKSTQVYWESNHKDGTDEYLPIEDGDNPWAWISYVVGLK
jgi:hypothetical protein